ncbi:hypothetical protein IGI04_012164 [Brassica rapa subsp. trilocularis]|uniref:Uncharacterized protein n=1 Tax=Brassica rapa subsp. trilocularis TaxID=1813537 RepID=A0ABQ7N7K2_BRACM|nr:hypothetical protein IGI04_012164 [Brassica rapa subsp. trilocularis]
MAGYGRHQVKSPKEGAQCNLQKPKEVTTKTSLALVIWRHKVWRHFQVACYSSTPSRTNKSMANKLRRIQPMIQRRIKNRAKD